MFETEDERLQELVRLEKQKLELMQQELELLQTQGLAFYQPHQKQDQFHRAGGSARYRAVFAGNRFGKSTCGGAEDCAYAIGERLWYPKNDPARYAGLFKRPTRILIVGENWEKVNDNFVNDSPVNPGKLLKFFPRGFIKKTTRNSIGSIDSLSCENGSFIKLYTVRSFKQDPMSAESTNWDLIHFDEPCPRELFIAVTRGLMDTNGHYFFTMTAISEPWIWDLFMGQDELSGKVRTEQFFVVQGETRDNGTLSEEAIQSFEATLNEEEKEARLKGKQLQYQGLVYKEFSWANHVLTSAPEGWRDLQTPPADWNIHVSMDVHAQTPNAFVFLAVSPLGTCVVYDAIFLRTTIDDMASIVKTRLEGRWSQLRRLIIDPIAYQTDPVHRTSIATELKRRGLWMLQPAAKAKASGIIKFKSVLATPNQFFVTSPCKRWLWEIQRYIFDKENQPRDADDHMMEATYRLFLPHPLYTHTQDELPSAERVSDPLENFSLNHTLTLF